MRGTDHKQLRRRRPALEALGSDYDACPLYETTSFVPMAPLWAMSQPARTIWRFDLQPGSAAEFQSAHNQPGVQCLQRERGLIFGRQYLRGQHRPHTADRRNTNLVDATNFDYGSSARRAPVTPCRACRPIAALALRLLRPAEPPACWSGGFYIQVKVEARFDRR